MPSCLIDLRCLQDPDYAERGIGRNSLNLLQHARTLLPGMRLVGLADPELPALPSHVTGLVDHMRANAYTGALTDPCCHVQFSPLTHDPLFVARLLHHPSIPAATAVHDFIPLSEPQRYLPSLAARLEYDLRLRWLARHQLFLPVSADTAAGLHRLGMPDGRIVITGAPLSPGFEGLRRRAARHILVIAGPDPRKNPECAVRAHARSRAMQAARIPLVVTGAYRPDWLAAQRAAAAALGGAPELIEAPGRLNDDALLALYAQAICVVAPSRAEGFSLPVIEAMASGTPVLASDIPAHRELLDQALFPADDDLALARLLDLAAVPAWRTAALARQSAVWPRFKAAAVAQRFWTAVQRLAPVQAPGAPRARPRVAVLTPLPPARSGVADYSAPMCAELAKRVELHVLTPTAEAECPPGAASIGPISPTPLLSSRYDRVVSVMGNSMFHLDILRLMLKHGGAAIQHDGRMLDLYAGHIGFEKTERMAEAEMGRPLRPNEIWHWLAGDFPSEALILAEIAARAEPLMMHSRAGAMDVSRRYGAPVTYLPFGIYRTIPESELGPRARHDARARIGIEPRTVLLASFGYVHPTKSPVDCIWALDLLRSWGIPARLHFVGAPLMPTEPLVALADDLGLSAHIRLLDTFVNEGEYRDHLIGADIGVQLRVGTAGAVSGALADCVAAGLPTVASATLADALDAPSYIRAVPDVASPLLVAEAAAALLSESRNAEERRAYLRSHGFDVYAARLCTALGLP